MTGQAVEFAQTKDGTRIAYRLTGDAKKAAVRFVLVHSLALDASVWDEVAPLLASGGQVLAYDCRGHGKSDRVKGPYTPDLFADDLAALLDHLKWTDVVVAGCSMGGCVTQAFAGRYPERVRGMALIDTTAWYGADAPVVWRERAAKAKADGLQGMAAFQTTRWFGDRFRAEHADRVQATMKVFTANDLDCYAATCEMLGDADLRANLPRYKMPVSVIVGEEDYATPVDAAKAMADAIANSTLTVLPQARHLTPIECPDRIAAEIKALAARI
jgi:3-oxoadipate enol-lactonase